MKVPKPTKLPSGTWRIRMRLGGRSISVNRRTKAECVQAAELLKAEWRNKKLELRGSASHRTLSSLIDQFIEDKNAIFSPSTICGYRNIQRNRFKSVMDKEVGKIDNWQRVVNEEAKICSSKTVRNAFGLIVSLYKEFEIPVPNVKLPTKTQNERPFLSPQEILSFLDTIKGDRCEIAMLLALHGLRCSELLAITKQKVKDGRIVINASIVTDEDYQLVEKKATKTSASTRIIPIMIPRLKDLIGEVEGEYLVGQKNNTINRHIKYACRKAGITEVSLHGLRHSFASLAYHLGLSELETMRLGGWSDYQTMRKIYTHLSELDKKKAENKITTFFTNAENGDSELLESHGS